MKKETFGKITLYNCDCLEYMKTIPDKYFDLAIVDPPYGINVNRMQLNKGKYKSDKKWDFNVPDETYFNALFRISKNQIIFGANYMTKYIPPSMGWIVWDKNNGASDFSDCELAFSSFDVALRKFKFNLVQQPICDIKNRFHPTQKPVQLYKWLLTKYANQGDKIFDSHFGSLSIGIACHDLGFELTACELDLEYYEKAKQRLIDHQKQLNLF